jgi:hypothetical protein
MERFNIKSAFVFRRAGCDSSVRLRELRAEAFGAECCVSAAPVNHYRKAPRKIGSDFCFPPVITKIRLSAVLLKR